MIYVGLNRSSSKNNHFSVCLVTEINYFVDYYLSFCPSFGNSHWQLTCSRHDIAENCWAGVKQQSLTHSSSHCVVCHFSIYEFWSPLWYFLTKIYRSFLEVKVQIIRHKSITCIQSFRFLHISDKSIHRSISCCHLLFIDSTCYNATLKELFITFTVKQYHK